MRGAPTPQPQGQLAGLYRAKVTRTRAGRVWVTIPDVAGRQEFGGATGFQYLDESGLTTATHPTTGTVVGEHGSHAHDVARSPLAAGQSVLVAAIAGRITDLVVLGRLKP